MREIKFRAWRKFTGMINNPKLDVVIGNRVYKVMQFTGLKDKNGKKIFEGDILDISNGIWVDKPVQVTFEQGAFGINGDSFNYGFEELNWEIKNIEVIGNIYENPELLEDKNA